MNGLVFVCGAAALVVLALSDVVSGTQYQPAQAASSTYQQYQQYQQPQQPQPQTQQAQRRGHGYGYGGDYELQSIFFIGLPLLLIPLIFLWPYFLFSHGPWGGYGWGGYPGGYGGHGGFGHGGYGGYGHGGYGGPWGGWGRSADKKADELAQKIVPNL